MKQTKTTAKHRKSTAKRQSVRARSTRRHVRIGLHPLSIFTQLIVGVFLVMSTISGSAASVYTVHATVPADPLIDPAEITSLTEGTHYTDQALTLTGTCPVPSYVILQNNGIQVGVATCTAAGFSFSILLVSGANSLLVQDYNITDQAGPSSLPITVYYDPPIPPPTPPTPPTNGGGSTTSGGGNTNNVVSPVGIQIMQVDNNVPFDARNAPLISQLPVVTGIAPPYSKITVEIHSKPIICTTAANVVGFWRCEFKQVIPIGSHTVAVTAVTPNGTVLKSGEYNMRAIDEVPTSNTHVSSGGTFKIGVNYKYQVYLVGQKVPMHLLITGGVSPYAVTINWGDGTTSTVLRASDNPSAIEHTYKWIDAVVGGYTIKIQATDAVGAVSAAQSTATLRNPQYHGAASTLAHTSGLIGLLDAIRAWLWLLWPAYIIVILMLISFWLGERRQQDSDKAKARRARSHARRPRPTHRSHA